MESLLFFTFFIALIPLLLVVPQVFAHMKPGRRLIILLNLLVWGYEVFFFIAVCGVIPHTDVHFGGGLGDLLYVFTLIGLIISHIIALSIMVFKVSKTVHFLIPLVVVGIPMIDMHFTAAKGNKSNDYMVMGSLAGLYYDAEKIRLDREQQRKMEEDSKPRKPEFATEFESVLYDAEHGDAWAMNHIGICYMNGEGIEKNDTLGVKWFRMAAEKGSIMGKWNLGGCYYNGEGGLEVDYVEAAKWFRKAAEGGLEDAQYQLGVCYLRGIGVEQSNEEAFKWLRKAAREEHRKAQELLKENMQTW